MASVTCNKISSQLNPTNYYPQILCAQKEHKYNREMDDHSTKFPTPHVVLFPLPLQGPVKCMLKLAELFCLSALQVTMVNTEHIQSRLKNSSEVESWFERYPNFRFRTIPDGLPEGNPRTGDGILELLESLKLVSQPLFREMLTSGPMGPNSEKPATCIVADGIFGYAVDVAKAARLPLVFFDTISPCGLWSYLSIPKLINAQEFPFKGDDLDAPLRSLKEMECVMRRRDLPSFCRDSDADSPFIQLVLQEDRNLPLAQALILNTFEELDRGTLSLLRTLGPKVYAIGPLHIHLTSRLAGTTSPPGGSTHSLWEEDKSCIAWLNDQLPKSVIYVSIGSLATMTQDQLMEIWYGLVNSRVRFLWVHRPGSILVATGSKIPEELVVGTKKRGYIVGWAPQEEVLAHPGIGGFLTHSGWNSTLESIVEGVPMIGWPYFVDQQPNSRYVSEVWKLGLDMKDTCDRVIVEKMVRDLMVLRSEEFLARADQMSKFAKSSVIPGGSSYHDLDNLIQDIKFMKLNSKP